MTYTMRDPTAEASPLMRERLPPPATLANRTIGLFSISKERSSEFLDEIERQFASTGATLLRFEKPTHTKPAPESLIADIIGQCDVVVEGLAD